MYGEAEQTEGARERVSADGQVAKRRSSAAAHIAQPARTHLVVVLDRSADAQQPLHFIHAPIACTAAQLRAQRRGSGGRESCARAAPILALVHRAAAAFASWRLSCALARPRRLRCSLLGRFLPRLLRRLRLRLPRAVGSFAANVSLQTCRQIRAHNLLSHSIFHYFIISCTPQWRAAFATAGSAVQLTGA